MKKFLPVIFSLFLTPMLFAQNAEKKPDIAISISCKFQGHEKRFIIDIIKNRDSINIEFSLLDSFKNAQAELDKAFTANREVILSYIDSLGKMGPQTHEKLLKMIKIHQDYIDKYSVYQRKNIALSTKDNPAYCNLLTIIANASTDTLEQNERNKKFVTIDGFDINFDISTVSETKIARTHTPTAQSNPLLHELLTKTVAIGRERKVNILSKGFFNYY